MRAPMAGKNSCTATNETRIELTYWLTGAGAVHPIAFMALVISSRPAPDA
jgi:hypothetical protein